MRYIIIKKAEMHLLEYAVQDQIKKGYEPIGGPCYVHRPDVYGWSGFYQAMIKPDSGMLPSEILAGLEG